LRVGLFLQASTDVKAKGERQPDLQDIQNS